MNNLELLEYVKKVFNLPNHYMYGTFGKKITQTLIDAKVKQYPSYYTAARISACKNAIGKYAFDCVGMIKSYYWGGIDNLKYVAATDVSANGMYNKATIKGSISTIDRKAKGLIVYMPGHVGVYAGDGTVYECTVSKNAYKIVHTKLDGRGWTHWFKCPYINWKDESKETPVINTEEKNQRVEYKKNEKPVTVKAGTIYMYDSTGSKKGITQKKDYKTSISIELKNSDRPYPINVYNDKGDCLGWVKEQNIIRK